MTKISSNLLHLYYILSFFKEQNYITSAPRMRLLLQVVMVQYVAASFIITQLALYIIYYVAG